MHSTGAEEREDRYVAGTSSRSEYHQGVSQWFKCAFARAQFVKLTNKGACGEFWGKQRLWREMKAIRDNGTGPAAFKALPDLHISSFVRYGGGRFLFSE